MTLLTKLARTLVGVRGPLPGLKGKHGDVRLGPISVPGGIQQSFNFNTAAVTPGQGLCKGLLTKCQPVFLLPRRCYADWNGLSGQERVTFLTDKNIESVIRSSGSLLIMFYAPWCGHCRSSKPEYARAAQMLASERPSASLAAIDCMIYPSIYEKYEITGYPTFKYYNGGRLIGEYHHRRKASDFVHFMLREPKSRADL